MVSDSLLNKSSGMDQKVAVSAIGDMLVMGGGQNTTARIHEFVKCLQYDLGIFRIEVARGFIRQNDAGTGKKGSSQSHALLLSGTKLRGFMGAASGKAKPVDQFIRIGGIRAVSSQCRTKNVSTHIEIGK